MQNICKIVQVLEWLISDRHRETKHNLLETTWGQTTLKMLFMIMKGLQESHKSISGSAAQKIQKYPCCPCMDQMQKAC